MAAWRQSNCCSLYISSCHQHIFKFGRIYLYLSPVVSETNITIISDNNLKAHIRRSYQFLVLMSFIWRPSLWRFKKIIISCIHLTCCNKLLQHSGFSAGLFLKRVKGNIQWQEGSQLGRLLIFGTDFTRLCPHQLWRKVYGLTHQHYHWADRPCLSATQNNLGACV